MVLRQGIFTGIGVTMLLFLTVSIPVTECLRYMDDNVTLVEQAEKGENEKEKEAKDVETEDGKICLENDSNQKIVDISLEAHARAFLMSSVFKEIFDPPPETV